MTRAISGAVRNSLTHPAFGPIVRATLESASSLCSDALGEKVDLAARILAREPSELSTFVQDIGTVVGMQIAQVRILEEIFDIPVRQARLSFGHSIGELSALVLGGVYEMEQLLPVPLSLATDCAELTADTTMGILSVHGGTLQIEDVEHLCASISRHGSWADRAVDVSLAVPGASPWPARHAERCSSTRCVIFFRRASRCGAGRTTGRRLHTPIVWERNIPNRTAMAMHHTGGGDRKPTPTVVSCATGTASYDEWNSRAILADWTDHPQRLWDVDGEHAGLGRRDRASRRARAEVVSDGLRSAEQPNHEAAENEAPGSPGEQCDPEHQPQ